MTTAVAQAPIPDTVKGKAVDVASVSVVSPDDPRWLAFLSASSGTTPFHHPAWARTISATYGLRPFAVVLTAGEKVLAGLPAIETRSLLRTRRWVSLPFTDACEPLAVTPAASDALFGGLDRLANDAGRRLEVRARIDAVGWQTAALFVVHQLELDADPDALRARLRKTQAGRNIARSEREGVLVRPAESDADIQTFYDLHLATRRRQGTPVQPRKFFTQIRNSLIDQGLASILLAEVEGRAVAAALFLTWNGVTVYKFGASDPAAWPRRPNHALFWTAIRESCLRGDRRFDLGRTDLDNHGLRAFKAGWLATEQPLFYSTLEPGASSGKEGLPRRAIGFVIRNTPTFVCRRIGESLYRYVG